jgi:uncharacterized protein
MKWATHELRKLIHIDNQFRYVADMQAFLNDKLIDLVDISSVEVAGSFLYLEKEDQFVFDVTVDCTLTMLCAITLEEVAVPLHFETDLIFGHDLEDDNLYPIEGNTIDLDPVIFANIVIEMPMRVVSEHAYDHYEEPIVSLDEEEVPDSNPFTKLKNE